MTYRILPPSPGGRRERRLRSEARLRTFRQVGTSLVVVAIAAGSFTTAGASDVADAWLSRDRGDQGVVEELTAPSAQISFITVSAEREVAYATIEQPDWAALAGARTVVQAGSAGLVRVTYLVTLHDGLEVEREEQVSVVVASPVDEIVSVGQLSIPPATDVEKGSNRALGQQMALDQYGWTGDQWSCLEALWTRESNWSHTSRNVNTGAYGIPQALPGDKMAAFGADWATNPATQISWGLSYVNGRYGTPCGAWGHFQQSGWY